MNKFRFFLQSETSDCGPTCLRMICHFYGKSFSIEYLKNLCNLSLKGSTLYNLQQASIKVGFEAFGIKTSLRKLLGEINGPCIIHWKNVHYVVLLPQDFGEVIQIADPGDKIREVPLNEFLEAWTGRDDADAESVALILKPAFKQSQEKYISWARFKEYLSYLKPYKKRLFFLSLLFASSGVISFALPFVVRNVIDKGVNAKKLDLVMLFLIAQFFLYLGVMIIEFVKSRLMLKLSNGFIISMLHDFLHKIVRLPISFFDTKRTGDIQQRVFDYYRIQTFVMTNLSSLIVLTITFIAFFIALANFSKSVLAVLILFSVLNILWFRFFLKKRREIDYAQFHAQGDNQDQFYEVLCGVQDLKLHDAEKKMIDTWYFSQQKIFNNTVAAQVISQKQSVVAGVLNNLENVIISFLSAYWVIKGNMSLGTLISINLVSGQFKGAILSYSGLVRSLQDAKISLERLAEIREKREEDEGDVISDSIENMTVEKIEFCNLSYVHEGAVLPALKNIILDVNAGETLAIVGSNGSGKTTLLKILLKFYEPKYGNVIINGTKKLQNISSKEWRNKCGIVMQEGYMFSGTLIDNILMGHDEYSEEKMEIVGRITNLTEWVDSLPLRWHTVIGKKGVNISGGQKQRILLARAIYKNPDVLLFDEATSAMDPESELLISKNIGDHFPNAIKIVIAHRYNTIRNANKIAVLNNGEIVEFGNHKELISRVGGEYAKLVNSQLNFN